MGMILSMIEERSCCAAGVSAVTASRRPAIIHDAFDSPGCTRAEMTTTRRAATSAAGAEKSVTESRSTALPPYEWHSVSLRIIADRRSATKRAQKLCAIVYVYG